MTLLFSFERVERVDPVLAPAPSLPADFDRSYDRLRLRAVSAAAPIDGLAVDSEVWPFALAYLLDGVATLVAADRRLRLEPGTLVVLPADAVRRIRVLDGRLLLVHLPAGSVGPAAGALRRAVAHPVADDAGTAGLVAQLLHALVAQPTGYVPENAGRLVQHIVGIVALMCAEIADLHEEQPTSLLQLAQEYIEANLADVDLSPDRIAASIHVSTRTLHRLFAAEGTTVTSWIRGRRLEHCRVELADATTAGIPVSSIGARWGFWDAAHFSRLFKSAFGASPRSYRSAVQPA